MNSDSLTYVVAFLTSVPLSILILGMLFRRISDVLR